MRSLGIIVFGIAAAATPIFSQAPAETRPSFEVASIKPGTPGIRESLVTRPIDIYSASRTTWIEIGIDKGTGRSNGDRFRT
jgi:hypothetical protein